MNVYLFVDQLQLNFIQQICKCNTMDFWFPDYSAHIHVVSICDVWDWT